MNFSMDLIAVLATTCMVSILLVHTTAIPGQQRPIHFDIPILLRFRPLCYLLMATILDGLQQRTNSVLGHITMVPRRELF